MNIGIGITCIFNIVFPEADFFIFIGKRTLQAVYRKPATDNLVQHGVSRPQNMPMSPDNKQNLLPGGCNDFEK